MSHRWIRRSLIGVAVLSLMLATTYVLRNPIATAMFASFTSLAPGVTCSHPDIDVDSSLTRAELEPFECTLEEGSIQRLRTSSPTRIELHGLSAPLISIAHARIDKRERDLSHVETNTLGDIGKMVGFTDPLLKSVLDEAESYSTDTPELRIAKLNAFRGGKSEGTMYGFRRWLDGEWMRTRVARMESGTGPVELREMDMRVSPTRGELSIAMFLGEAERGERPDAKLKASGRGLNNPKPRFELSLDTDEDRTARAR
jgi:hypothetical protein